jgi:hypothetical protein
MNAQPSSTIRAYPSQAPDILHPQRMYQEFPQLREIQNGLDQHFYMSVQDSLERHFFRLSNNVRRLAADDPVHWGWIMPYQPYPYPDFTQAKFLRLRSQVLPHLRNLMALPGIKGVAGHIAPHYFPVYDAWFCMAHIVIFGNAPMDYLSAAVSARPRSSVRLRHPNAYAAESVTSFPRGGVFGPCSARWASRHLRYRLNQPGDDPTQLGRFVAGLRESDLLILRGIRQMPGGRLAFKN